MAAQRSENVLNKTVYTPVFNTPSTPEKLKGYLGYLSREHVVLAHIMTKIPPSTCEPLAEGNEVEDLERKARIDALCKRVQEAYKHAKGDAADGKWGHLVRLLRMSSIKGRARWIGSTIDAKQAVSSEGWINARTEGEWFEWERRWKEEERLKQKVESWQQKVDPLSIESPATNSPSDESYETKVNRTHGSSKGKAKALGPVNDETDGLAIEPAISKSIVNAPALKAAAALGFPVVKRSSLATMRKPKPAQDVRKNAGPSNSKSLPVVHNNATERRLGLEEAPEGSSSPVDPPPPRGIADISEQSFLPPSFQDSRLVTSTPNKPGGRHKPSPIPEVPASSPLSSPPSARVYGRQRITPLPSSSFSQLPSTPTRNPTTKRPHSPSPYDMPEHDHALKKARTTTLPSSSSEYFLPTTPPPAPPPAVVTPKRPGQLPTLTELLASAKKAKLAKIATPKGKERAGRTPTPLPVNEEVRNTREEEGQARERQRGQEQGKEQVDVGNIPFPAANPTWATIAAKLNTNLYEAASPAKSLSSLAASDSGSDGDDDEDRMNVDMDLTHGDGFDPPLASTQAEGKKGSTKDRSYGWVGYNSQFDVDGKVDEVSKFMEKDVSVGGDFDYDYDGWVREPSP